MTKITFIGDVHGRISEYLGLIKDCEFSIQLGDMGFDYSLLRDMDATRHRFVPGNHENYRELYRLIDRGWWFPFGPTKFQSFHVGHGIEAFADMVVYFIRGGFSIDMPMRTIGVDWFDAEEMGYEELFRMSDGFNRTMRHKPGWNKLVVSHECPAFLVSDYDYLKQGSIWTYIDRPYQPSRTAQAMEKAWKDAELKPEVWVFGHHHVTMDAVIEGTRFICVPELGKVELEF